MIIPNKYYKDYLRIFETEEDLIKFLNIDQDVYIITDANVYRHWSKLIGSIKHKWLSIINPGEDSKNMSNVLSICNTMLEKNANREACIVNIGGGVVTDLGGFIASLYKRGIQYINVPTTILGMVDASIGGKTGVDFNGYKNMIGAYHDPSAICLYPEFIGTLDDREKSNGYFELLKTSLITKEKLPDLMSKSEIKFNDIYDCAKIKLDIIDEDPYDYSKRQWLNIGHTIGHAIESYYLNLSNGDQSRHIKHGEAVMIGMLVELQISKIKFGYKQWYLDFETYLCKNFSEILKTFKIPEIDKLEKYLINDKKNSNNDIVFALVHDLGDIQICSSDLELIQKAISETNQIISHC